MEYRELPSTTKLNMRFYTVFQVMYIYQEQEGYKLQWNTIQIQNHL